MAGRGPAPKKPQDLHHGSNAKVKANKVSADGEVRGPELPFGFDWPAQTRIWWDNWRRSAQAQDLSETDWDFLLDTAMLHAEFWAGNLTVGAELRLRVAKFGATPEDRLRLRLQVERTPEPTPAKKPGRRLRVVDAS